MKVHGAAAMALLIVFGVIADRHALPLVRRRSKGMAGTALLALFVVQAVSGYGLWYFEGDRLRAATEWLHWAVGFTLPCVLARHVLRRRARRVRRTKDSASADRTSSS
ncbi:hypothetical protein [Paraburkholderia caledonica]|uniref:Uncharacterized protein n=1 Tax=Paraburkholderia caledonica TaxID=134536 RepID=A0AB73II00_9BURK|nr:hypothetical protein [Paraburkholderia caledonica]